MQRPPGCISEELVSMVAFRNPLHQPRGCGQISEELVSMVVRNLPFLSRSIVFIFQKN